MYTYPGPKLPKSLLTTSLAPEQNGQQESGLYFFLIWSTIRVQEGQSSPHQTTKRRVSHEKIFRRMYSVVCTHENASSSAFPCTFHVWLLELE
jgi:hypothetical protein